MIKTLQVIDSLYYGGAEVLLKNFLIETKKYKDFQIDLCILYSKNCFKDELEKNFIKIYDLNLKFKYDLRGIFKLLKLIRKNEYDIVHVHLFPSDMFVAITSIFAKKNIKYIFTEHSVFNRRRKFKFFKILDKFTYSRYDKIICVSEVVKKSLLQWLKNLENKIVVIRNGIPFIESSLKDRTYEFDILFIGKLEYVKGVDILIKSIKYIEENYNRLINVALIGDGKMKFSIIEMIKELNIKSNIKFIGWSLDIQNYFKKSKILVLPSRWEGLPMVILESMMNLTPVIAANVGGVSEVIEDGANGCLFQKEDFKVLGDKIVLLLENDKKREEIATKAYEKVRREFNIEIYTKKLLDLYTKILENEKK